MIAVQVPDRDANDLAVKLSWPAYSSATGYLIYRSSQPNTNPSEDMGYLASVTAAPGNGVNDYLDLGGIVDGRSTGRRSIYREHGE